MVLPQIIHALRLASPGLGQNLTEAFRPDLGQRHGSKIQKGFLHMLMRSKVTYQGQGSFEVKLVRKCIGVPCTSYCHLARGNRTSLPWSFHANSPHEFTQHLGFSLFFSCKNWKELQPQIFRFFFSHIKYLPAHYKKQRKSKMLGELMWWVGMEWPTSHLLYLWHV